MQLSVKSGITQHVVNQSGTVLYCILGCCDYEYRDRTQERVVSEISAISDGGKTTVTIKSEKSPILYFCC